MGGYTGVSELQTIKHDLKERNIAKYNSFVIKQFKRFDMASNHGHFERVSLQLIGGLIPNTIRQQDQQSRLKTSLLCLKREHNPKQ